MRAIDILEEHRESEDNGIDGDDENEEKYYKLRGILLGKNDCPCLQTRRPIEKAKRKKNVLIFGLLINVALLVVFIIGIEHGPSVPSEKNWTIPREVLLSLVLFFFIFAVTFFLIATCRNPGFI